MQTEREIDNYIWVPASFDKEILKNKNLINLTTLPSKLISLALRKREVPGVGVNTNYLSKRRQYNPK